MKTYKIKGEFKGTIDELGTVEVVDSLSVNREEGDATGGYDSAVRTSEGNATGGWYSAVRTSDGNATGGYDSAVRTHVGDAKGGDWPAVRTDEGNATGGHWSAVRTRNGKVTIGDNSVGMGSEAGDIGTNSIVAIVDPDTGRILKVIIRKEKDVELQVEVIE